MDQSLTLTEDRTRAIAMGVAAGFVCALGLFTCLPKGRPPHSISEGVESAQEMMWVNPRLARSLARALHRNHNLTTGADMAAAAQMLSGSDEPQDVTLAYGLAIAARSLGEPGADSMVSAAEGRLFGKPGRVGRLPGAAMTPVAPQAAAQAIAG